MFRIEENGIEFEDATSVIDWLRDNVEIDEDAYDEMLDDCYPDYNVGYLTVTASEVLKEFDPIAYRIGKDEWLDSELDSVEYELDRCDAGDVTFFYDYNIICLEDEE